MSSAAFSVVPFEPGLASTVAAAWSRAYCDVPHCYPVGSAALLAATEQSTGLRPTNGFGPGRTPHPRVSMRDGAAFAALSGSRVVGFVDCTIAGPERATESETGAIRALWYERGQRAAGQALLDAALGHLRGVGAAQVDAFRYQHRYLFHHVEHALLSDRLDQVRALLGLNGFKPLECQVVFDWPDYAVAAGAPPLDLSLTVERATGNGPRDGLILEARQGERQVGFCACTCGGDYSTAREAADWLFTAWLWVADDLRGRGLGQHLLRLALAAGRDLGYRHASLCTGDGSYRATLLYANLGYRAVDWTRSWRLTFTERPS